MNFFAFGAAKGLRRFPIGDLGGSDPVSTFGRQNRTNTGVAPAQIEVFACGLFAAPFWPSRLLGGALSRRTAEREGYVSTRTLRVVQCSAALNEMREGRVKIKAAGALQRADSLPSRTNRGFRPRSFFTLLTR